MSYDNMQEDVDKCLLLLEGESHEFNFFQDGGSVVYKECGGWDFYTVPLYGGKESYDCTVGEEGLLEKIKEHYNFY